MKYLGYLVIIFVVFSNSGPGMAASLPDAAMDSYVRFYEGLCEKNLELLGKWEKGSMSLELMDAAALAALLHEKTGDARYLTHCKRILPPLLKAITGEVAKNERPDFHAYHSFATLLESYGGRGPLGSDVKPVFLVYARHLLENLGENEGIGRYFTEGPVTMLDHNRVIGCMLGTAAILKAFGEEPDLDLAKYRRLVDRWWRFAMETADLDENSGNYTWLGQAFFIDLARILGRMEELQTSVNARRMFLRNRYAVSPSGRVGEFGDDHLALDVPKMDLVYVLEVAARLYREPSCRNAALRVFSRQADTRERFKYADRAFFLLRLPPFEEAKPGILPENTMLTTRLGRLSPVPVPDKLRLATGWGPDDSMAWFDLYAEGSHAHRNRRPQICYLELQGVPVYFNTGRRPESPLTSTSFWLRPADRDFLGGLTPFRWNTVEFDIDELLFEDEEGRCTIDKEIRFIFSTAASHDRTLLVDHLRLIGDGGTRRIHGFEDPLPKERGPFDVSLTNEATEGQHALRISLSGKTDKNSYIRFPLRDGGFSFDRRQFDRLALDLKVIDNDGLPTGIGLFPNKDSTRGIQHSQKLTAVSLVTRLSNAWATNLGADGYGEARFSKYVEQGTALRRQTLLTREGILVLRDTCFANPGGAPSHGGQLWNLYGISERGDHWFCSKPFSAQDLEGKLRTRRLLVKFLAASGLSCDVQSLETEAPKYAPAMSVCYSRRPVERGRKNQFVLVLVPLLEGEDASSVARGVTLGATGEEGATITLRTQGSPQSMAIGLSDRVLEVRGRSDGGETRLTLPDH